MNYMNSEHNTTSYAHFPRILSIKKPSTVMVEGFLVETAGVEPASRDPDTNVSTCVVWSLRFRVVTWDRHPVATLVWLISSHQTSNGSDERILLQLNHVNST